LQNNDVVNVTVKDELSRRIDEKYGLRSKNIHPRAQAKGSDEF
jgi:hypothetical protein